MNSILSAYFTTLAKLARSTVALLTGASRLTRKIIPMFGYQFSMKKKKENRFHLMGLAMGKRTLNFSKYKAEQLVMHRPWWLINVGQIEAS